MLIGYWGPNPVVRELDTTSKETVWIYGERQRQGRGDLYDRLSCPVRVLRYGIQERGGRLTVICDERSRILCVNRDYEVLDSLPLRIQNKKELVWEPRVSGRRKSHDGYAIHCAAHLRSCDEKGNPAGHQLGFVLISIWN